MEALVELLPLLFVAAYYILAGRRKAKQKRMQERAHQPEAVGGEPAASTPFQSFLEQLEQSLAEANGIEDEKPQPEPEPIVAAPSRTLAPRTPEFSVPEGSFGGPLAVDHEAHGFGAENPLSEEVFEQAAPFAARPRGRSRSYDPHQLVPKRQAKTIAWHRRVRDQVRDPMAARDAFVLQTVFGKRGGRKGH